MTKNTLHCKSIIVRFTGFKHRTMFYQKRPNLKNNVELKLVLTKKTDTRFLQKQLKQ